MANNMGSPADSAMNDRDEDKTSNGDYESQKPDLHVWPGWVELESEPAYFNVMLKDMGVQGIKLHEVFSLDPEDISLLPQPVYALIFLFKYKPPTREDLNCDFPDNVWFARQVPNNACATYALLNIVTNLPQVRLGPRLQQFKADTMHMTPLERGDRVDDLNDIRAIHNSFATENDLIAMDEVLQTKIAESQKRAKAAKAKIERAARAAAKAATKDLNGPVYPSRTSSRLSGREPTIGMKRKEDEDDLPNKRTRITGTRPTRTRKSLLSDDAAYHFCAYMPIDNKVWKLDGLEPTPEAVDNCPSYGSWLDVAVPALQERMMQYDAIEFNLMAVVEDPLSSHKDLLLRNVKTLMAVEENLAASSKDWREGDEIGSDEHINGPSALYNISAEDLDPVQLAERDIDKLQTAGVGRLFDLRKDILVAQPALAAAVRDELVLAQQDEKKAFHRRFDYARFVRSWLDELVEVEALADIIKRVSS